MIERIAERGAVSLAERTSRRSFLGRVGMGFVALVGGPFVAIALRPDRAEAHHLCGHIFTTGSCPHPYAPRSRVDRYDKPLHPYYGYPIDDRGDIYTSHSQSRRKICQEVTPAKYPYTGSPVFGVAWARCCNHRIRKIHDCCSYSDTRINGDASVTGYCNGGRKVFCILYRDTNVRC